MTANDKTNSSHNDAGNAAAKAETTASTGEVSLDPAFFEHAAEVRDTSR
jgi:hypothetical protein